ncbi:aspartate aminotransferase family protein [Micromonospora sp. Rc5]|nr:aspartate aminotransferase family protein [Micromonospora sp. Rc5]
MAIDPYADEPFVATAARDAARERDRRYLWHTWSPVDADRTELMMARGQGYHLWDVHGRHYVDASSAALNATCGYAHPHVVAAVRDQIGRLQHFDLSMGGHEPAGRLAERIASLLSPDLSRTLLVNSGSEAIEAAVFIAASYWAHVGRPRTRLVTFSRSYHGATLLTRSMSRLPRSLHPFAPSAPVTFVDLPAEPVVLRRPESLGGLLDAFAAAIGDDPADRPAAVVVEPFLNVGGAVVLPEGFLRGLRELCDSTGTLLVLDEVFTGFGRTGRMFAFQHEGIEPDILVTGKGLCSGYLPIASLTARRHIYDSFAADPVAGGLRYGHTTSGHAVACAGALATIEVLEQEGLVDRAARLGARLLEQLTPLNGRGQVVDVRGLGLTVVLQMASPEAATALLDRGRAYGVLLRRPTDAVMAIPPLVIDEAGIDAVAERIHRAHRDMS